MLLLPLLLPRDSRGGVSERDGSSKRAGAPGLRVSVVLVVVVVVVVAPPRGLRERLRARWLWCRWWRPWLWPRRLWWRLWLCLWWPAEDPDDDEDDDEEDDKEDESEPGDEERIESDELERLRRRCVWWRWRWWRLWPSSVLPAASAAAALPVSVRGTGMNEGASAGSLSAFIRSQAFASFLVFLKTNKIPVSFGDWGFLPSCLFLVALKRCVHSH